MIFNKKIHLLTIFKSDKMAVLKLWFYFCGNIDGSV